MSAFAQFSSASECRFPQAPGAAACPAPTRLIRMSIDAASITALRQLAMRLCGDVFGFMRTAIRPDGSRIQVWLCVQKTSADLLGVTTMQRFPDARISGRGQEGAAA